MPLHIVPTPIGDPEDITLRALRVLREADVVAAEDTRTTAALLAHHGVTASLTSFHDHNEDGKTKALLARIAAGESVALVSDAGTPLVNDPGWPLVQACIAADLPLHVLPGPSAVITALVGSGLPVHCFTFAGFVPRTAGDRDRLFEALGDTQATLVFYESPTRLAETLDTIAARWPRRQVVVARNLTKRWEQWLRGTAAEVRTALADEDRGEVVLLIGPGDGEPTVDVDALIDRLLAAGEEPRRVRDQVAEATGISKRTIYQRVLARRG